MKALARKDTLASVRVGVDIGGTFTDLALVHSNGVVVTHKRLTTPSDPVQGFVLGVSELLDRAGVPAELVGEVRHATTLGSNVVIERQGAPVAFLTTAGFGDVLEIQRAVRFSIYDTQLQKPKPLVPRSRVWEVRERMLFDGTPHRPLDDEEVRAAVRAMRKAGIASLAIGFLHSYANPSHERMAREIVQEEAPEMHVTISSDVSQLAKEYARFNTTVVNAYLAPIFRDYLSRLEDELVARSVAAPIWIMQSSGGLTSRDHALALPVRSIESGPAAGVIMAAGQSRLAGYENVISFDMGGTTAKASIVTGNRPAISRSFELDMLQMRPGSGLPIDTLSVDLIEIGAGGGSIAHIAAGALQVGPRSAGSEPGPACYGRGGFEPTVTDAALMLGYLDADAFAGGTMRLDRTAAANTLANIGARLGLEPIQAAWGIHQLVCINMVRAIRLISIDKGLDPRNYAMVCFGGAGPIHAARLARNLGVKRLIVPPNAGVGSALGLLEACEAVELARTYRFAIRDTHLFDQARAIFADLHARATELMRSDSGDPLLTVRRMVGLRYVGQGHEIEIDFLDDPETGGTDSLVAAYKARYATIYGYAEDQDIEVATWRLTLARSNNGSTPLSTKPDGVDLVRPVIKGYRAAFFGETGFAKVPVFDRFAMKTDDRATGPCVIEERDTATVLLPGDVAWRDMNGALIVDIGGAN